MSSEPQCPKCQAEYTYADRGNWVCPSCGHEWSQQASNDASAETDAAEADAAAETGIKDAHGNLLADGDSVTVIKELKIKGASAVVKVGTKVRNIRLVDGGDGHDIACKIDGIGSINLKSEFVKKA